MKSLAEKFWEKVKRSDECWEWIACRQKKQGYGSFRVGRKSALAHRVAWTFEHGDPGSFDVLHKCDNPACVRPDHLFLGTDFDNQQDCRAKGRRAKAIPAIRGEKNGGAKLTADDVKTIRHLHFAERRSRREIARFFGCCSQNIDQIINRKIWGHV